MREEETVIDSVPSAACCAKAGAEISMARTAVLLDSARRRLALPAFMSKCMIDSPLEYVRRLLYFLRLSLDLTLTRQGKYRKCVTEDGAPLLLHLRLLAVAAIGADSQILHSFNPIGDGRCADPDAHMVGPQLLAGLGVKGHDVTVHFAGKYEIAGSGQHAAEHQMIAEI